MKELSIEQRALFEEALKWTEEEKHGYVYLRKDLWFRGKRKIARFKRSRIIVQLALNQELEPSEHVHHMDENKKNDQIYNLQVLSDREHLSLTHAGKKRKRDKNAQKS